MANLTAALPRLVLQLTNDHLARDSDGIVPWRMTYDALDAMVFDHLKTPSGQATVLSAMMGDLHDIANGGPNGSAVADREINTGILQLAIEHAAREALDNNTVPNTAGLITDNGVYISADLGRGYSHAPEGTKVLVSYAGFLAGDAAGQGGTIILNGTDRVLIEANNGVSAAFNGLWTSNELIFGGRGNDVINAFAGNDAIFGLGGRDRLWGHAGNDLLSGGADADFLAGGPGDDILIGGATGDRLHGEAGRDMFVFDTLANGATGDVIVDFAPADDTLAFDNAIYTALGPVGPLAATALAFGGIATAAAHRFVYNTVNGVLLYDADGSGALPAYESQRLHPFPC
ncbi:MAG: calcium-binding protein [Rhizobiales bacterium]|nr:calcium-binding protein [Hyphomicrobiales bacterium]